MITIVFALIIFIWLLEYIVIFDVILSWLTLIWLRVRPRFIRDILDPIYNFVTYYIPTRFGAFDFTPIVVIMILILLRSLLISIFPEAGVQISQL